MRLSTDIGAVKIRCYLDGSRRVGRTLNALVQPPCGKAAYLVRALYNAVNVGGQVWNKRWTVVETHDLYSRSDCGVK